MVLIKYNNNNKNIYIIKNIHIFMYITVGYYNLVTDYLTVYKLVNIGYTD